MLVYYRHTRCEISQRQHVFGVYVIHIKKLTIGGRRLLGTREYLDCACAPPESMFGNILNMFLIDRTFFLS